MEQDIFNESEEKADTSMSSVGEETTASPKPSAPYALHINMEDKENAKGDPATPNVTRQVQNKKKTETTHTVRAPYAQPVLDASKIESKKSTVEDRLASAKERRLQQQKQLELDAKLRKEKEDIAHAKYVQSLEDKRRRIEENKLRDDARRREVEQRKKQNLEEDKRKAEARVARSEQVYEVTMRQKRSSSSDRGAKRWSWGENNEPKSASQSNLSAPQTKSSDRISRSPFHMNTSHMAFASGLRSYESQERLTKGTSPGRTGSALTEPISISPRLLAPTRASLARSRNAVNDLDDNASQSSTDSKPTGPMRSRSKDRRNKDQTARPASAGTSPRVDGAKSKPTPERKATPTRGTSPMGSGRRAPSPAALQSLTAPTASSEAKKASRNASVENKPPPKRGTSPSPRSLRAPSPGGKTSPIQTTPTRGKRSPSPATTKSNTKRISSDSPKPTSTPPNIKPSLHPTTSAQMKSRSSPSGAKPGSFVKTNAIKLMKEHPRARKEKPKAAKNIPEENPAEGGAKESAVSDTKLEEPEIQELDPGKERLDDLEQDAEDENLVEQKENIPPRLPPLSEKSENQTSEESVSHNSENDTAPNETPEDDQAQPTASDDVQIAAGSGFHIKDEENPEIPDRTESPVDSLDEMEIGGGKLQENPGESLPEEPRVAWSERTEGSADQVKDENEFGENLLAADESHDVPPTLSDQDNVAPLTGEPAAENDPTAADQVAPTSDESGDNIEASELAVHKPDTDEPQPTSEVETQQTANDISPPSGEVDALADAGVFPGGEEDGPLNTAEEIALPSGEEVPSSGKEIAPASEEEIAPSTGEEIAPSTGEEVALSSVENEDVEQPSETESTQLEDTGAPPSDEKPDDDSAQTVGEENNLDNETAPSSGELEEVQHNIVPPGDGVQEPQKEATPPSDGVQESQIEQTPPSVESPAMEKAGEDVQLRSEETPPSGEPQSVVKDDESETNATNGTTSERKTQPRKNLETDEEKEAYRQAIAEKRRELKEKKEQEERERQERIRLAKIEQAKREEEARRMFEEAAAAAEEEKRLREERELEEAEAEVKRKEEEKRMEEEMNARKREAAEKLRRDREQQKQKQENERLERKKRLEKIMRRTRQPDADSSKKNDDSPSPVGTPSPQHTPSTQSPSSDRSPQTESPVGGKSPLSATTPERSVSPALATLLNRGIDLKSSEQKPTSDGAVENEANLVNFTNDTTIPSDATIPSAKDSQDEENPVLYEAFATKNIVNGVEGSNDVNGGSNETDPFNLFLSQPTVPTNSVNGNQDLLGYNNADVSQQQQIISPEQLLVTEI